MQWTDEGYLLSKNNFNENSIIIDAFTLNYGKYTGIIYGGSSRRLKKNFQIGNKILFHWKSRNENRSGYFSTELINPVSPMYFDDKKRSISILSATSILKILLPERQINKKIYNEFDTMINDLKNKNWIKLYILWELSLIKELGFDIDLSKNHNSFELSKKYIEINNKKFKIPKVILNHNQNDISNHDIKEGLEFNKSLLIENFILPNKLKLPLFRNMLETYFT